MSKITFLGGGSFGTALAVLLAEKNNIVNIKGEEEFIIEKYDNLIQFFKTIKNIGSNSAMFEKPILTPSIMKKLNEIYQKNYTENNKILVTNHLLYFVLKCE